MNFRLELPCNIILVGMTKSGKTHLLKCLMALHCDFFNYGVCFSSTSFNNDYEFLPDEYVYEDYQEEIVVNIMKNQRNFIEQYKQGKIKRIPEAFIIIDDQLGLLELHKKRNLFDILFAKSRHLHISIFLSIQTCAYLSTTIRANSMYVFITVIKNSSIKMMYDVSRGFNSENEFRDYLDKNCVDYRVIMFDNSDVYTKDFCKIIRAPENIPEFYLDY